MRSSANRGITKVQSESSSCKNTRERSQFISGLAFIAALGISAVAFADDGCQVLLCLATPNGWSNIAQCGQPMQRLMTSLAQGQPLPSCPLAGRAPAPHALPQSGTGSYAVLMTANYYDQCPAGTTALPVGSYAVMSPNWIPADNTAAWVQQQTLYAGIGDGTGVAPATGAAPATLPPEVCASGAPIGHVNYLSDAPGAGGAGLAPISVNVYTYLTVLQPSTSPNLIGVFIDGALFNQVHW